MRFSKNIKAVPTHITNRDPPFERNKKSTTHKYTKTAHIENYVKINVSNEKVNLSRKEKAINFAIVNDRSVKNK